MKVELYADSKNKQDTKLIIDGKEIDLSHCVEIKISINSECKFITIDRRYLD